MTPEKYERAKALFERAVHRPSPEQTRLLEEEESDVEVREAVAAMLAFDARCPDFLAGSPLDSNATLEEDFSHPLAMPDQIAGFRILGRLGAGATGTVFDAEQRSPKRRVALKILTHLRASHASEQRFRREAEVLARLEHPGIARVIESGTASLGDDRVHYIALELIDGLPLDEHCRKKQLSDRQRIELLAQIADAVQHAHARGIVHRDLKPSNILVDEGGTPKVLDFGIARLIDDGSEEIRSVTLAGQVLGTLAYMSPEQANGYGQVGVVADIFALGAILYDLPDHRPTTWAASRSPRRCIGSHASDPPPSRVDVLGRRATSERSSTRRSSPCRNDATRAPVLSATICGASWRSSPSVLDPQRSATARLASFDGIAPSRRPWPSRPSPSCAAPSWHGSCSRAPKLPESKRSRVAIEHGELSERPKPADSNPSVSAGSPKRCWSI